MTPGQLDELCRVQIEPAEKAMKPMTLEQWAAAATDTDAESQ